MSAAQAARPEELIAHRFRIADLPVEIHFTGTKLSSFFLRALSHLSIEKFAADEVPLRIDLWDETATGIGRPFGDLRSGFAECSQFSDGVLANSEDGRFVAAQTERACTILDLEGRHAIGWVGSADRLSSYEIGKPLQPILFAWYNRHRVQPLHAGLVAKGGDGVLIGGAGGSGKSTTSLACTMAGFSYLADDYTGLPPAQDTQTAFSLYASLWLEDAHSRQFDSIRPRRIEGVSMSEEMKLPFALNEAYPESMAVACTVRAVVLPRVAHIPVSRLRRASPAEAMLRLAPSSVLQLPFISPAESLRRIAELLRNVPSFWLDLGTELETIPLAVEEALLLARPFKGRSA